MAIVKEFKEFALKGNVVDLAVAVVMGAAFGKIVSAVVGDLIMPLVNALMPKGDWRTWEATALHFKLGDLLGTVVDFVVVAMVIFIVVVKAMQVGRKKETPAVVAAPATKACPECLETVPAAARRCRACATALAGFALLLLLSRTASAQTTPEFAFAKPEEVKTVEWKAQAKAGALLTGGNSQTQNVTLGASASRKSGDNRFSLEGGLAYGRSNIRQPIVDATSTMITGIDRQSVVSTNTWYSKGRYDRFLTPNNILYASAQAGADKIAGKSFTGGGQLGYSRQLLKTDMNLVVAELGYDLSYEEYVQQPGKTLDAVSIHSARVLVSEALKLTSETGLNASVEALFNLNKEAGALNVGTGQPGVDAFKDTRVIGKLGLTSTIYKNLSMTLGFTLKYDQNPAPLPIPAGSPAGAAFVAGFQPFADKVDVLGEAALSYAFL